MKLALRIHRTGGSIIPMPNADGRPDTVYHFKPETAAPGAPHVCEVADEAHLARFLSIAAYSIADAPTLPAAIPVSPVAAVTAPTTEGAPTTEAPAVSPALAAQAPEPEPQRDPTAADLERFDRPTLMKVYEDVKGVRPHAAISIDTLRIRIAEAMIDDPEAVTKVSNLIADADKADEALAED